MGTKHPPPHYEHAIRTQRPVKKKKREKKKDLQNLKDTATNADTKSEEADDSKTVFSDLTFTVAASPAQVKLFSASAKLAIPDDPNIQGIFDAAGAQMKVLATTTTSETDTVSLVIPKSQVAILAKNGATLVYQGGKLYSMNALMILYYKFLDHGISKPTANGQTNVP